jgi:hypothetical protein
MRYVDRGSRIRFPEGAGNFFLLTTASRMALGPTQPPIQWVPGALSLGYRGRDVKLTTHLHLVQRPKMRGVMPPLPNTSSWRGA